MSKSGQIAIESLISEIAAIRDMTQRKFFIARKLRELEPAGAAEAMNTIIAGSLKGKKGYSQACLALIKNRDFSKIFGDEFATDIYEAAKRKKLSFVTEILTGKFRKRKGEAEPKKSHLAARLKSLTLGERKAFARRKDFKKLEFLLHDSDPSVISNILLNPKVTEKEVIKIASDKMTPGGVLEVIFESDKWVSRYSVRKALVFNENTPVDISVNLCSFLMRQDLKLLSGDGKLDPAVVKKAKEVLRQKAK